MTVAIGHRPSRLRTLAALVLRETGTRFGPSWGGYAWALAEPIGGVALLAVAFSFAFHAPPLGRDFMLFYASGLMPFLFFSTVSASVANAVRANRGLLVFPAVRPLDTLVARGLLEVLTQVTVSVVVIGTIFWARGLPVDLRPSLLAAAFGLAALFGLAVGVVNAVLFGLFPSWRSIWAIMNRPLFVVSGVLFLFESLPAGLQAILWFNPLVHLVGLARAGLYPSYDATGAAPAYVFLLSLALLAAGGLAFRRAERFLARQ